MADNLRVGCRAIDASRRVRRSTGQETKYRDLFSIRRRLNWETPKLGRAAVVESIQ